MSDAIRDELAEVIGYAYNNEHVDPAGHAADAVLAFLATHPVPTVSKRLGE